jgi:hypothetical protein
MPGGGPWFPPARGVFLEAFSGEVDTGSPQENATNKTSLEHDPIQLDRATL